MRANFRFSIAALGFVLALTLAPAAGVAARVEIPADIGTVHPRVARDPRNRREEILRRIATDEPARAALEQAKRSIDEHVTRHESDPTWIVSRLQMYWKSHATEVFIKGPFYDRAGGAAAPVPTVRFPGGRDSTTNYAAPKLEDMMPFAEDPRGVFLLNKTTGTLEWADPAKTGRVIESINTDIMRMAQTAATVFWVTGDERYARFAFDLFDTYMMGMHHRSVPVDLTRGHHQTIAGLSTFEVIQERILGSLATTWDFLHDYAHARAPEKSLLYAATFKKWIDNTITNGVPFNNWDLIEARTVLDVALVLENDSAYDDRRGAQYYMDQVVNRTTLRQWSLLDLLDRGFDANTGIWNECPGYSLGVVGMFAGLVMFFDESIAIDLVPHAPVVGKSVLASAQYLYPNGYVTSFGDSHYTRLSTMGATQLVMNAQRHGRRDQEELFTRFVKTIDALDQGAGENVRGARSSGRGGAQGLNALFARAEFSLSDSIAAGKIEDFTSPLFHAPNASFLVQRSGSDPQHALMITQHASLGNHMHANGIAIELYGKGVVLAPSSGIGTSYFQPDYAEYYSQFPAHNTVVVDGISSYPVMRANHAFDVVSCYPASSVKTGIFPRVTFSDAYFLEPETNADQRRQLSIVRTSVTTGYYVDVFRSRRKHGGDRKHEYFYHNLGQDLAVTDAKGGALVLAPTDKLAFADGDLFAYDYFWDKKAVKLADDFRATFTLRVPGREDVAMNLWMQGAAGREIFAVKAPPSRAFGRGMIPEDIAALPLPTIVAQQTGEAWTRPFVAVFEPSSASAPRSIESITPFAPAQAPADFVGMRIEGKPGGSVQHIFSAADARVGIAHEGMRFCGTYAVISETSGALDYLFLGSGRALARGEFQLVAEGDNDISAALAKDGDGWSLTATGAVTLTLPESVAPKDATLRLTIDGAAKTFRGSASVVNGKRVVSWKLPATPYARLQ